MQGIRAAGVSPAVFLFHSRAGETPAARRFSSHQRCWTDNSSLSSISSNLAAVIESLNAEKADPKQDPAAALRRLRLPGKAREPYVDVVHFNASDLTVVARTLDDEREKLQLNADRADEAVAALTRIE